MALFCAGPRWTPVFALTYTPPQLAKPELQNGKFRLLITGRSASKYVLETSTGLLTWSPASTNTVPASGSITVEVPAAAGPRARFYRVREDVSSALFLDRFNRPASLAVGGSWAESDASNLLSLDGTALRLSASADRSAHLRASGGAQLGVKISCLLNVVTRNNSQVLQIGTRAGGAGENPYRDCFGFAILPAFGVQPNDTKLQGALTPFTFRDGTVYEIEMLIFADASRELRVWRSGGIRPSFPTAFMPAQTVTLASGARYQIGFDSGSAAPTDLLLGEFRVEPISGSNGTTAIFTDAFERSDSSAVGGDWTETDPSNLLSIDAASLRLTSNADRSALVRVARGPQLGVMMTFTLNVTSKNNTQVLQVGTRGGGGVDSAYRDCFGFAILPAFGVVANDTTFQGDIARFTFDAGAAYRTEVLIFADNSRELRVWPEGGLRPSYPTAFALAQPVIRATGTNYQIGFDSGGTALTDLSIDDFHVQSIASGNASSAILFDPFDRTDSPVVGAGWAETDRDNLLVVQSGALRLSSSADRSAYLRAGGGQLGVKLTFKFFVIARNGSEVLQIGTRGGGGVDNPYRDCFGFAILPAFGVVANDTTLQGAVTPFTFADGTAYQVEILIAQDKSRELRVWPDGMARPSVATLAVPVQAILLSSGSSYQIGFDSGSARPSDLRIDEFRIEKRN